MRLDRQYCKEGYLAFRLKIEAAEVGVLEAKLGRPIVFSGRFAAQNMLGGIYDVSSGDLEIGPSTWLPVKPGQDPLTDLLRPSVMPLIEAELAKVDEERGRQLLAEAHQRGWVVIQRPSEALKETARLATAGDLDAMEALERLGEEQTAHAKPSI